MAGAPYIVWSPDGKTPPKVSFDNHKAAYAAAWGMAKVFPNQQFFVMGRTGKGALVQADLCVRHPDQLAVTNLDGEHLCQLCADAWSRAEGQAAAEPGEAL